MCWTSHLERLSSVKALPCLMPWQCHCLVGFQCKKTILCLKKKISFQKMGKRAAASGATVWTFVDRPSPSNSAVLWSQLTWQPNRVIAMSHDAHWPPQKRDFFISLHCKRSGCQKCVKNHCKMARISFSEFDPFRLITFEIGIVLFSHLKFKEGWPRS